ncbi:MAG: DNA photolyase [Spirochaetes bacterium]|nr:DNA photolyase [Spirochaetota bacterium]
MKTIDDIKAVVYQEIDSDNPMVRRFAALRGKEIIACSTEDEMERAVDTLKVKGIPSKEVVILKRFMGRLSQKCPGSPGMICCNYLLLNTGFNCLYNCTYCYLNYYLNSFGITQFINIEVSFRELPRLSPIGASTVRVGTGEYTDSLMFDEVTGIGSSLIGAAARNCSVFLELKTKSDNVEHLLDVREKGNAVLAWSLNTPRNIALYEQGSADLDRRIAAASAACRAGYLTAFHFDPIILHKGWVDEYLGIVDLLFRAVDPERVAWISLGCFRYSPGFREIIRDVFPDQALTAAEMFPGPDGKFRYLKKNRISVYSALLNRIRSYSRAPFVYLCMETGDVWRDVFDADYHASDDLERAFISHLEREFLRKI